MNPVRLIACAFALMLACLYGQPAPPAARDLVLVIGKGELLQFPSEIQRVVVSEPKIADAVVVSPKDVMVNAKGLGKATVIVWDNATGAVTARYNVAVVPDSADYDDFLKKMRESMPDSNVNVTMNGETLVLTGAVKDLDTSKRAAALASTRARNVVNLLQVPPVPEPRQILLQVKFASVDRVALSELGFNYFSTSDKGLGGLTTQQFQTPRFSQLQFTDGSVRNPTVNFADLLNLFVFRPDLNIGATIRAMATQNLLQILAEPNLITLEGKEASFLAGGEFPFPTLTSTTTGGAVSPVVTVQFKKFGIQLNFTPDVTPQGSIHLRVQPEVSALDFENAVTLQGFLIPAISTRRADTEVVLKDGESFAIAGLIDNRVVQTLSRVRGLGDVPIIGNLFRSRSTKKSSNELLVVITPRFVKPLSAEEKVKLPDMPATFLPTVAQEKAAKDKKKKKKDGSKEPTFVGPRGHEEPK